MSQITNIKNSVIYIDMQTTQLQVTRWVINKAYKFAIKKKKRI